MNKSTIQRQPNQMKENLWKKIIMDWQTSELTQQNYCHTKKVNFNTFTYWRGRLKSNAAEQKTSLSCSKKFVPIAVVSGDHAVSKDDLALCLRNGRMIKISKGFDEETLQRLLRCTDV